MTVNFTPAASEIRTPGQKHVFSANILNDDRKKGIMVVLLEYFAYEIHSYVRREAIL